MYGCVNLNFLCVWLSQRSLVYVIKEIDVRCVFKVRTALVSLWFMRNCVALNYCLSHSVGYGMYRN